MLLAVAAASPRTIRGDRITKAVMPATMTINHKPPAILAFKCGDIALSSIMSTPLTMGRHMNVAIPKIPTTVRTMSTMSLPAMMLSWL
jgi:hypothetical protein